ncbi:MAG: NTP transferase domain-containing protein [Lentisphaerae bacterium]|nr:NTP transferase domain-containing protein [Lentisphaerota bacterium]
MLPHAYALILAGGRGERFWPLSTTHRPKQLLKLIGKRPMIATAVNYLRGLVPPERTYIITRAELVQPTHKILPTMPRANIIGEPVGRDTAAAITLGITLIKARDPQAVVVVLTADHIIGDLPAFQRILKTALQLANSTPHLITLGIKPSWASTAFGYIASGQRHCLQQGVEFMKVKRFIEKPSAAAAARYLKSGTFFWNSGMFVWSVDTYQKALAQHCPALGRLMQKLEPAIGKATFNSRLRSAYQRLPKISVDYALMEKATNIIMAKGNFAWDDIGSWSALENHFRKDRRRNIILGQAATLGASGNIVVADAGLVALIGVDNLVVVRSEHATLICPKDRAQDVKAMVELLRRNKQETVL